MQPSIESTEVVVIGAGQAGLSVAYFLRRLGLTPGEGFVVVDRGPGAGGAWQHRWSSLRLGSAHRVHDLPGMAALGIGFATADRRRPARDVVAEYYTAYEEFYGLGVRRPDAVTLVENEHAEGTSSGAGTEEGGDSTPATDARLRVTTAHGPLSSRIVVNATGTWGSPFVPYHAGRESFLGRQIDTSEYVSAREFADQQVVVVGGGTSAIGFLLELERVARSLIWATRRPVEYRDGDELGLEAGVAAVALQDEAARAGRALPSIVSGTGVQRTRRIVAGIERGVLDERPMFHAIEPNGVRWPDGSFSRADAIIWATGFRPELRHLAPLRLREREGGIAVSSGVSISDPRVFLAGYGPQASTIGANRAGRLIARQVVARLSQ